METSGFIHTSPPRDTWFHSHFPPPSGQNGGQFADDIFNHIFMNENIRFIFPTGPIDNKSPLVQAIIWRWTGGKPLLEPMMTQFTHAYMRH